MLKKLKAIFSTATWKQSRITVIATILNGLLGAGFYILVARFLGPFDFGVLTVAIATLTLLADITDFGTNTGLVRFVSAHLKSNPTSAFKFMKLGLELKIFFWLGILTLGFFFSGTIASLLFKKEGLILPLQLAMIGVGGALLFTYSTSLLQSLQKYISWGFINISANLLRLVLILILIFFNQLNLERSLLVYIIIPFFGFSISLLFLPSKQIFNTKGEFGVADEFFKFNRWVAFFTIIAAISSRLDTFLNARLLSSEQVGIYGAANQLTQVIPQIVGALGVVAAPKFASFNNNATMLSYFKKLQLMVAGLGLIILTSIPVSFFTIPIVYGAAYSQAVVPFSILIVAMVVFLISVPLHNSIIFYFGRSDIFVWVSIIHFFIIAILGTFLISNFGITGTALTVLVGMLANLLLPLMWFVIKIRK